MEDTSVGAPGLSGSADDVAHGRGGRLSTQNVFGCMVLFLPTTTP